MDRRDPFSELITAWSDEGRVNLSGKVPTVSTVASSNITAAVLSAASKDELISIFTTAEQVDELAPSVIQLYDAKAPCVIYVAAEADTAQDDATTLRSCNCPIIWAATPQECHDAAAIATAVASSARVPVVIFFDATNTGHVLGDVVIGTPGWLERFLTTSGADSDGIPNFPSSSRRLSDGSVFSDGSVSTLGGTSMMSASFISPSMGATGSGSDDETLALLFSLMTTLALNPIEYSGSANATTVIVGFGPGSTAIPATIKANPGMNLGFLQIRALRPWSTAELVNKIPRSATSIIVLDSSTGRGLYEDVTVSLAESGSLQAVIHVIPAHIAQGFTAEHVATVLTSVIAIASSGAAVGAAVAIKPDPDAEPLYAGPTTANQFQGIFWKISSARRVLHEADVLARDASSSVDAAPKQRVRVATTQDSTPGSICSRTELIVSTEVQTPLAYEAIAANVDFVSFNHSSLLLMPNYDLLPTSAGAVVVVNCAWSGDEVDTFVPSSLKHQIADKGLRLFLIDADSIARRHPGSSADEVLQALFWPLCTQLETPAALVKRFAGSLPSLVSEVKQHEYPSSWADSPSFNRPAFPFVPVREPHAERDISPVKAYSTLLAQLFGDAGIVADNTGTEALYGGRFSPATEQDVNVVFGDSDGRSEVSLGAHMARIKIREQLVQNVTTFLERSASAPGTSLTAVLTRWLKHKDDGPASRALGKEASRLLHRDTVANKSAELTAIADATQHFAKPSKWILGGDSWAFDISYSGIHHVMASGEDVNILVFDTTLQSKVAQVVRETGRTRKDIGLYAMNYGDVFVASTAESYSRTQAIKALLEADAFKGPSVVLAYTPIVTAEDKTTSVAEVAASVDSGMWPLYRWNPSQEKAPFVLDSQKLREDVRAFVKRDTDLSLVYERELAEDLNIQASLEDTMTEQVSQLLSSSVADAAPVEKIDMSIVVVYGSDNGNGMAVAEGLARKAEVRHVREVRCIEANMLLIDDLKQCDVILFVISTAGQGEMCGNAKTFWSAITKAKAIPASVRYAIFGLGDSAYWGKGTADSARYFCKPALELEKVLDAAGATKLAPAGLGDDQDENGYDGALVPWRDEVFGKLEVHKVAGEDDGMPVGIVDDDLKVESNYLRGDILKSLADTSTGSILPEDAKLTKFHGIYQQDDREERPILEAAGKERAYTFMIRVGIPGGVCEPHQMLRMLALIDSHCGKYGLKLTTRQAFQVHGVVKKNLKPAMQVINKGLMDTLAACGDVNRNVIASPMPIDERVHAEVLEFSQRIQLHLKPKTAAYHEIWLDKKMVAGHANEEVEPLYGPTYLPRKFKIAIAVPPQNDVDVFSHCLGFIAIVVNGKLLGYNVTAGGGMGMTHGNVKTYPRLADILGFCNPDQAIIVGEKVMLVQRDHGERNNRKHARLKYTMEDHGVEWYRDEVEKRCGFKLGKPRPFKFTSNGDRHGWVQGKNGKFHYGIYVEHGRVMDTDTVKMRTALEEIAKVHKGDFRLTANQQLIIGNVDAANLTEIASLLQKYNIDAGQYSEMRLNSMACVALPTCALAMAESERYLGPVLVGKIEAILERNGLFKVPITIRMTGCPNGCARPYMAEIAFVGKAPGAYNMYLGGGFAGQRLTKLYRESVTEPEILEILEPMLVNYAQQRIGEERFGDFLIRTGVIEPCLSGNTFHETDKEKIHAVKTFSGTNDIYW